MICQKNIGICQNLRLPQNHRIINTVIDIFVPVVLTKKI